MNNFEKIKSLNKERMAKLERKLNAHALKECFLDELEEDRGSINEIMPQCNIFCGMI